MADTTALIECYRGAGIFSSGATTIANFGTIQGTGHYGGVYLYVEGTVTNGSAADTTAPVSYTHLTLPTIYSV